MFLSLCLRRAAQVNSLIRPKIWSGLETSLRGNVPLNYATVKYLYHIPDSTQFNSIRRFNTTTVFRQEEKPHDHAKLWIIEKATSALMLGAIPLGLLVPNRILDTVIAILITAHSYWGMEAVMVEYVRVLLFGPLIPKIAIGCVYVLTVLMLGGLFYLIFNDIGLCRAFWRIWRNMRKPDDNFKRR